MKALKVATVRALCAVHWAVYVGKLYVDEFTAEATAKDYAARLNRAIAKRHAELAQESRDAAKRKQIAGERKARKGT